MSGSPVESCSDLSNSASTRSRKPSCSWKSYFRKTISTAKGPFDVVTEADHAVESMFAERLAQAFPDHAMVGEETGRRSPRVDSEYCWVLDPLDGTVNFAVGQPFFAVSLGLLHRGVPLIGWVRDPVHDERFRAIRGQGATLNDVPLGARPPIRGRATGWLEHRFYRMGASHAGAGILSEIIDRFGKISHPRQPGLHLCYVAAGRLRLAASVEAKLWDDVAGALIVEESGRTYGAWTADRRFRWIRIVRSGAAARFAASRPTSHDRHDCSIFFEGTIVRRSLAGGIS